jgi:hypothetical protein
MSFDRSKYKKQVSIDEVDDDLKKAQATMKNPAFGNQGGRASFYTVNKEGRYELRVLPSVKGEKPYISRKVVKLPIECPIYDKDGKDTGKKEVRQKDVFTSDVHSDKMGGKDAVMIYIDFVYALANDIQDSDEKKKFLAPITGYFNRQKQWVWGVSPNLNYVCYVYVEDEIHRFDVRPQWWKKMKNISLERSNDNVINIDIFSDCDEGYPLIINTTLNEKGKSQFDISCGLPDASKRESWDDFFLRTRVPDNILQELEELPSLEDQYKDVFSRKDWDMQIEGLERFDKQNGFEIFQNDEFLNALEELEKLVPEDDEVKQVAKIPSKKKEEPKQTSTPTTSYPPLIKMKAELNDYIEAEYEGTEKLPNLSVTELRKWYDMMKEGMMLPFDDYRESEENDDSNESEEKSPINEDRASSKTSQSVQDRLAGLRNRMKK